MKAILATAAALLVCVCTPVYAGNRVLVDRGDYTGSLELRIGVLQESSEPKWIDFQRLGSESAADIQALAAGSYIVLLSGEGPFERFAVLFGASGDDDAEVRVTLPRPQLLHGTIRVGTASAGDAVLHFRHEELGWSTSFSARPDGTFDLPLWQPGRYVLIARGGTLTARVRRPVRIEGADLTVDLSPLKITGVVTDEDGVPIPEAKVALRNESGRELTTTRVHADEHGMFEFVDVKPGPYSLAVVADGYLVSSDHRVYVTGETPAERVGIALGSGLPRRLRIVDAAGKPVANATVNVFSTGKLRSTTTTDIEGRATVSIDPTGTAVAWVIPSTGSFAVARLDAGPGAPETKTLVIPDGSASVIVEVLTPTQSGVPGIGLLLRYNGEMLLPSALTLRTDDKGRVRLTEVPPGRYEFWPYTSVEEAAELIAAQDFSPGAAPITIEAAEGESRATVLVEKNESIRGAAR